MLNPFPKHVFRKYDIRGLADSEISVDFAKDLGRAFVDFLPKNNSLPVVVGRDVRLSGEKLMDALIGSLRDAGVDVVDIGIVPTPLAYFTVFQKDVAGCIVVTASHNPSRYNGFKMMVGKESLFGGSIMRLKLLMQTQEPKQASQQGSYALLDMHQAYIDFIASRETIQRKIKVVIDAGNGPTGLVAAPLYRALGCDVVELYCNPDGRFPNHHPDPTVEENLQDLAQEVLRTSADLGVAFDGDGDRIGVVDEKGNMIWADMLLLLLARQLLKQRPNSTIISEAKSSQVLYEDVRKHGGTAIMWKTGHSLMKAKMKETGSCLAGEMSGHFFFADRYFGFDDATYAGIRVMQLLAEQASPLSSLLNDVPQRVCTPEIQYACDDDFKFTVVEAAKVNFATDANELIDVDGMRLVYDKGWSLLRASNTQPALVLRYEAEDEISLQSMREKLEGWLSQYLKGE